MHAFLVLCVIVEALFIGVGFWYLRRFAIWSDSALKDLDDIQEGRKLTVGQVDSFRTAHNELAKQQTAINSAIRQALEDVTEQIRVCEGNVAAFKSNIVVEMYQTESKVSDLAEGCEKMDSDLSVVMSDVQELVRLRHADVKEAGERIAQIADEQEKIRRKAARPGAPNQAFASVRGIAETNSFRPDSNHDALVALAEGSE